MLGRALSPDPAGTVQPDFVLGDDGGANCEPGFVQLAAETLRGCGPSVSLNVPFHGAELVSTWSEPVRGRHSLEINRRLSMDEGTRDRTAGFEPMRGAIWRRWGRVPSYCWQPVHMAQ
jgi:N-formylglutamate amidohydrolase